MATLLHGAQHRLTRATQPGKNIAALPFPRHPVNLATSFVLLSALIWLTSPVVALAGEPLTIGKLLADPQSYHLRVITLQGTVHQVQILADAPGSGLRLDFQCSFVHPPYTFVLADDTGFLQVSVSAKPPCVSKMSPVEPPDVGDGDKVLIDVQITVAHRYSEGVSSPTDQALAVGIRRQAD